VTSQLEAFQQRGFPVGGERVVALDLVDTHLSPEMAGALSPDRFDEPGLADMWWSLETGRLPDGPQPDLPSTRRLRSCLRAVFEAALNGTNPPEMALEDLNAFAASVPISRRLDRTGNATTRWHSEYGGFPALAFIAGEAIELLADHEKSRLLRRCGNTECSALFLAENPRRVWCASNVCGNRARVARHYQRRKAHS